MPCWSLNMLYPLVSKKPPYVFKKRVPTGYQNPRCYLASTNDCSDKITGEHLISEGILKLIPNGFLTGMPWQPRGERKQYSSNSLKAKVLCKKHNSSFSVFDDVGIDVFRFIR